MPERSLRQPTKAELELLRVLWDRGPSTVREIHEALSNGSLSEIGVLIEEVDLDAKLF